MALSGISHLVSRGTAPRPGEFFNSAWYGLSLTPPGPPLKNRSWDELVWEVKSKYAKLIGAAADDISLFHSTTAAAQRVLIRLNNELHFHKATLLTTDIEYPSIYPALSEIWRGPVVVVEVARDVYRGNTANVLELLSKAILRVRPGLVYFSHVVRSTGFVMPVHQIARFCKEHLRPVFVCVDGAQAVGNVVVAMAPMKDWVDAYLTSGHKWLNGKRHMGLLHADPRWRMEDASSSYSMQTYSRSTGNELVLGSLAYALDDFLGLPRNLRGELSRMHQVAGYNRTLAERFVRKLGGGFDVVPIGSARNGLLAIRPSHRRHSSGTRLDGSIRNISPLHPESVSLRPWLATRLRCKIPIARRSGDFEEISDDLSLPPTTAILRVCFHLYHTIADVDRLAGSLNRLRG